MGDANMENMEWKKKHFKTYMDILDKITRLASRFNLVILLQFSDVHELSLMNMNIL